MKYKTLCLRLPSKLYDRFQRSRLRQESASDTEALRVCVARGIDAAGGQDTRPTPGEPAVRQ